MSNTSDPNDPRLTRGIDKVTTPQAPVYLILSDEERAKGFIRPVRQVYIHKNCGSETRMGIKIAETYARDPKFYGSTYCCHCQMHRPLSEFHWKDNPDQLVGS